MQFIACGHSITMGFWDPAGGWVQRLREKLDERALEEQDEELVCEVYNLGVSGDYTTDLLERFDEEVERRLWEEDETTIILQIGANDIIYLSEEDRIAVPEEEGILAL